MSRILVAVDFSQACSRVLDAAIDAAKAYGCGLVVMHVAAPGPEFVGFEVGPESERQFRAEELREEHRQLQAMAERCASAGLQTSALLVAGVTVDKLIEEADRFDARMIVVGSHGHGAVYHLLVGSVAEGLLKHATRPVLVVPCRG